MTQSHPMPMQIFMATPNEIDELVDLRVLMQKEVNGEVSLEVENSYRKKVHHYFSESLGQSYFSFVAKAEGRAISAVGVVFYQKPPSIEGGEGYVGYVTNMYTVKEFRGQGIAEKLMRKVVEFAKTCKADKLHLGATDAGIAIYERVGFKKTRFEQFELKIHLF